LEQHAVTLFGGFSDDRVADISFHTKNLLALYACAWHILTANGKTSLSLEGMQKLGQAKMIAASRK